MQNEQKRKLISPMTMLGLSLSLVVPTIYALFLSPVFLKPKLEEPVFTLINFAVFWILALGVLLFTLKIENLPLKTIGWQPLSWKWILAAIGIGVFLSIMVPILTILVSAIIPVSDTGTVTTVTSNYPWWILLLSAITAGVTEEILFRGYALERLLDSTRNKWVSAFISLVFFVAIHTSGWNIAHIVGVVVPLGTALTGLYLWRRNLLFVMIIHTLIDLPLAIMALLA